MKNGQLAEVHWLSAADRRVSAELRPQLEQDLRGAFPKAKSISVCDCFFGYSQRQGEKIVLGVEVKSDFYRSHIVKLGAKELIAADYDGWAACVQGRPFYSRVFMSVSKRKLKGSSKRLAIIYEDALQYYGDEQGDSNPRALDSVVFDAIERDDPTASSVSRVISQVYADLYRWFYRSATPDPQSALRYYQRRLRSKSETYATTIDRWRRDKDRRRLRRDVDWLLCGTDAPTGRDVPLYLDPVEAVCWMIDHEQIPETLVGQSHGDLHGRNILVGIQRHESEYPAVFDYGEMGPENVLVWDFVKLEMELTVRILDRIANDSASVEELLETVHKSSHFTKFLQHAKEGRDRAAETETAQLSTIAFAALWQKYLANRTRSMHENTAAIPRGASSQSANGSMLQRATSIILSIRAEAATWLGTRMGQRESHHLWREEYFFGLAAYAVGTAKYDYRALESTIALVTGGVACAELAAERNQLNIDVGKVDSKRYFAYQTPLREAYRHWMKGKSSSLKSACSLLAEAVAHFPDSVPLRREYALVLFELGRWEEAQQQVKEFTELCSHFQDHETLCRLGRAFKDRADADWMSADLTYEQVIAGSLPMRQWFATAHDYYQRAFEFSRNYYPGINAAFTAFFARVEDPPALAKRIAKQVAEICADEKLDRSQEDAFWIFCTEGEAMLIQDHVEQSVIFYVSAMKTLNDLNSQQGQVVSAIKQLRRLQRVLGEDKAGPVLEAIRKAAPTVDLPE